MQLAAVFLPDIKNEKMRFSKLAMRIKHGEYNGDTPVPNYDIYFDDMSHDSIKGKILHVMKKKLFVQRWNDYIDLYRANIHPDR